MNTNFRNLNIKDIVLMSNRIDIWQFILDVPLANSLPLLNQEEQQRATRYHFPKHQRRFAAARSMMRLILSRYTKMSPETLVFTNNQHGKPQLTHPSSVEFNISHSGDLALLAIGKDHELGVDLENFSERPYEGIAEHLFSPNEIKTLQQSANPLKPLVFFHIWSQKEAFIKACGLGLAYPTQEFDVSLRLFENKSIYDPMHNKTWMMRPFMPQVACNGALCHHSMVDEMYYVKLDKREIMALYASR